MRFFNQEVERVTFSDANAKDTAVTARLDLWLLPFANIYGIIGYIDGKSYWGHPFDSSN